MAQTGYTPISLYYTTTAAAVPTSGNLVNGELAINITDGKLYYKNNSGVVTLLAGATAGPAGGSNTQVQYNSSGALAGSANLTFNGTTLTAAGFSGPISGVVTSTSITDSGLTSGRVTYAGTAGLLQDSANLTFNGTTLTANTIGAFTLSGTVAGGGNQLNNVIIGTTTPLAGAFTTLSATGTVSGLRGSFAAGNAAGTYALYAEGYTASTPTAYIYRDNTDAVVTLALKHDRADAATAGSWLSLISQFNTVYGSLDFRAASGVVAFNGLVSSALSAAGTSIAVASSTGLAVTGTLSSTGTLSGGTSGTGYSFSGSAPATSLTLDSSGNLGLGVTPSAWSTGKAFEVGSKGNGVWSFADGAFYFTSNAYYNGGWKYGNTTAAGNYQISGGAHAWSIAPSGTAGNAITFTQAMTLDASGNWKLGTTDTGGRAFVSRATVPTTYSKNTAYLQLGATEETTNGYHLITFGYTSSSNTYQPAFIGYTETNGSANSAGDLIFGTRSATTDTAPTERARIDSSGNLLVGQTSQSNGEKFGVVGNNAGAMIYGRNTGTSGFGSQFICDNASWAGGSVSYLSISGSSPNNTARAFLYASDSSALRFEVYSNGGIANYAANNVILSDRREKTNFAPAGSYLDKICAIPVQTFNYIDQNMEDDGGLTLGVVAQDVQEVAPELVAESNWAGKDEEPKMRLSIYQTDLQYALMKCIQEQQAIITALTTRITALENK
jgi:Chaperone of endosialidase